MSPSHRKGVLRAALLAFLFPLSGVSQDPMTSRILITGSRIDVSIDPEFAASTSRVSADDLLAWIHSAAESVAAYYGRYPVPQLTLRVASFPGRGVRNGRTFGDRDGAMIVIKVGNETLAEALKSDWMLTHEMVHLAFPSVHGDHHWIEEGISTYVEPIARVRAGRFDAAEMWAEVVRDIPQGLPGPGDRGLDHTHTWGRTYWGGALFCLLADVDIRRRTHNRKGLDDALRGILSAGGDIRSDWDLARALRTGDKAAGVSVLVPLYKRMKDSPSPVDLSALWKEMGISLDGKHVVFNDQAPLAAARAAITAPAAVSIRRPAAIARPVAVFAGHDAGPLPPHRR